MFCFFTLELFRYFSAYGVLSDDEKRRQYDAGGMDFQSGGAGAGFDFRGFNFDDMFSQFDDFEDEFGGHRGGHFGGSHFKMFHDMPSSFDSVICCVGFKVL